MANLWNVTQVLTFTSRQPQVATILPGQGIVKQGTVAEPVLGLKRRRPLSGQIWPRPETPQRDKLGVI